VTRNSAPFATSDAPWVQGVPVHNVLDAHTRRKYVGVMMQVAWNTTDWLNLNDAFQFQHSLRVQVETMGHPSAEAILARDHPAWTTAAFWYAAP
jgi:hypothetical protein